MPLYDFRCETHGHFERFASMSECERLQPCPDCSIPSSRVYVAVAPQHLSKPLVVWKREDGTYAVPAQPDARKPVEYERVELRSAIEIRGVERSIDREEREKFERAQIGKEMLAEGTTATNRSELRQKMQHFHPHMRDFAQLAMDNNNAKPRAKYRGAFYFEALSQNASNREDGRNRDGERVRK